MSWDIILGLGAVSAIGATAALIVAMRHAARFERCRARLERNRP